MLTFTSPSFPSADLLYIELSHLHVCFPFTDPGHTSFCLFILFINSPLDESNCSIVRFSGCRHKNRSDTSKSIVSLWYVYDLILTETWAWKGSLVLSQFLCRRLSSSRRFTPFVLDIRYFLVLINLSVLWFPWQLQVVIFACQTLWDVFPWKAWLVKMDGKQLWSHLPLWLASSAPTGRRSWPLVWLNISSTEIILSFDLKAPLHQPTCVAFLINQQCKSFLETCNHCQTQMRLPLLSRMHCALHPGCFLKFKDNIPCSMSEKCLHCDFCAFHSIPDSFHCKIIPGAILRSQFLIPIDTTSS